MYTAESLAARRHVANLERATGEVWSLVRVATYHGQQATGYLSRVGQ